MNYSPNYSLGLPLGEEKYDVSVFNANASVIDAQMKNTADSLTAHVSNHNNPHAVTKDQVGLGNVDNTSDANKPLSTAQQTAITNAISTEQTRATNAEASLSSAIAAEQTRATNVESALSSQIGSISGEIPSIATVSTPGLVSPDGTTITIDSNGQIHGTAPAQIASVGNPGIVAPDGSSITIDANGTIRSNAEPSPSGLNFFYGTCPTSGSIQTKVVTASGFTASELKSGTLLAVKFDYQNSTSPIYLNVNSTGDKGVVRYGTTTSSMYTYSNWSSGQIVLFVYDGTYWSRINPLDNGTTSYAGLQRTPYMSSSGAASSTGTNYQTIVINGSSYEIRGSRYMEIANTAGSSFAFTNTAITTSSIIDVYTDTWGDNPSSVSVSGNVCTVSFSSSKTRTVRIYIK